jgi:hypothetical protein
MQLGMERRVARTAIPPRTFDPEMTEVVSTIRLAQAGYPEDRRTFR